jgi:isopenicillin N synthase-like dioxygenase
MQTSAQRQSVGDALHDACLNVGFFYARGHGVPTELTDGVMAEARRWFARPVRSLPCMLCR